MISRLHITKYFRIPRIYKSTVSWESPKYIPRQTNYHQPSGYVASHRWLLQRPANEHLQSILFTGQLATSSEAQNAFMDSPSEVVLSGSPANNELKYDVWKTFAEIENLDHKLLDNLSLMGMGRLTPVQRHVIGLLSIEEFIDVPGESQDQIQRVVGAYDLMAASQTGSGKTLAYLVPLINRILRFYPYEAMQATNDDSPRQFPSGLILAPTRELVQQIFSVAAQLSYRTFSRALAVYGGERPEKQRVELQRGCHLVIATPGRLLDFLKSGFLSLLHCRSLVLDEADRMLDMGFEPQLREILESPRFSMPPPRGCERQTSLYSATFPPEVAYLAKDFLRGSKCISVSLQDPNAGLGVAVPAWGDKSRRLSAREEATNLSRMVPREINQQVVMLSSGEQLDEPLASVLQRILSDASSGASINPEGRVLIFCNTKREVDRLDNDLYARGFRSASIHGDKPQSQRTKALDLFRKADINVLIASSVASRGLDIPNVNAVINVGLPRELDDYVHRIGRTGRMGKSGEAITFTSMKNMQEEPTAQTVAHGICRLIYSSVGNLDQLPTDFVQLARWHNDHLKQPFNTAYSGSASSSRRAPRGFDKAGFRKGRGSFKNDLDSRYG